MPLPYSYIVSTSAVVSSAAFTTEKKHMLLAMVNPLIPTSAPFIEFSGASALTDFNAYFGQAITESALAQKYFSFLSKAGNAPEKLVVARWYKTASAPFLKGSSEIKTVAEFAEVNNGSFGITIGGQSYQVSGLDFTGKVSYAEIASTIQAGIRANAGGGASFTNATVEYSTITKGFIITGGETGATATIGEVTVGTTGTDISSYIGMIPAVISQGANAETFAQFCDRIYHANTAGYSITTAETLTEDDIVPAVQWLQTVQGGQTYNTVVRLVFNINDLTTALAISSTLSELSYTGYVLTYDPNNEFVNVLDCAICASIDYTVDNGSINFNFQPAVGYTSIMNLGSVVDYQEGKTNFSLMAQLDNAKVSCVYSVGFGTQEQTMYGSGLMAGAFGTEDVQVNESALEQAIQLSVINALVAVNKVKLQGSDAQAFIGSLIAAPLDDFKANGSIARNGVLDDTDKVSIAQATGNPNAAESVEKNGYYFKLQPIMAEDIANRQVHVLICYLCGGVVNKVRIIDRIYGA